MQAMPQVSLGFFRRPATFFISLALSACSSPPGQAQGPAPRSPTPKSTPGVVRTEIVARGLDHPWALEFLPDGRLIVTEKEGRVRIVDRNGRPSAPLAGV